MYTYALPIILRGTVLEHRDKFILWHVDPFLGNDRETSNYTTPLLGNGSANRHERNISTAKIALQQRSGVFCAVRAEIL
jgi:hypothetical protein